MTIPGQIAMRKGLESEAERINTQALSKAQPKVELLVRIAGDGQSGIERQISQMYELIKLQPDAIIVQPTDNALRDHGQDYETLNTYKAVQPKEGHKAGLDILKDFPAQFCGPSWSGSDESWIQCGNWPPR